MIWVLLFLICYEWLQWITGTMTNIEDLQSWRWFDIYYTRAQTLTTAAYFLQLVNLYLHWWLTIMASQEDERWSSGMGQLLQTTAGQRWRRGLCTNEILKVWRSLFQFHIRFLVIQKLKECKAGYVWCLNKVSRSFRCVFLKKKVFLCHQADFLFHHEDIFALFLHWVLCKFEPAFQTYK